MTNQITPDDIADADMFADKFIGFINEMLELGISETDFFYSILSTSLLTIYKNGGEIELYRMLQKSMIAISKFAKENEDLEKTE